MKEYEDYEAWEDDYITRYGERPTPIEAWKAARKVACEKVCNHFENYTNPQSGLILALQVREILK